MEQKILNVPRQGHQPSSKRGRQPARTGQKPRRSPLAAVGKWLYRLLVVLSALIVGGYLIWNFFVRPPAVEAPPAPPVPSGQTDPVGGSSAAEDPAEEPLVRREGVYNVLLAATDKEGYRTDTMMVMSYDVANQKVGVVSIPRDTLVARESGNPKLVYGSGGVSRRAEEISDLLGIPIDYYVKVNIKGFIALVDYLGGVDFYVPEDMDYDDPYQELSIHYTKGQYHLTGQQAMEVARFRKNNDGSGYTDVGRTQTQQKLLVALAKKVLSWNSLTKINGFVEIFNKNVDTDLSLSDMLYFASQAVYLDTAAGVETTTLTGNGETTYHSYPYCYALDKENTLNAVNRLLNPYTRDLTLEDMNIIG